MKSPFRMDTLDPIFEPIYSMNESGVLDFKMLLNGDWVSLSQRIEVHTPIDDSLIATVPSASIKEAEEAVEGLI